MNVLVLTTHFHNQSEVLAFLDMLYGLPRPAHLGLTVCICDNSGDWSVPEDDLPFGVHVVRPEANLGYINGCALALTSCEPESRSYSYVMVTNTDVVLDQTFLRVLYELRLPEQVGVIAPAIRLPDGTPQNPFLRRRPTDFRLRVYQWCFASAWGLLLLDTVERIASAIVRKRGRSNVGASADGTACERIYAAHGSLFLLRPEFLNRGGKLAYGAFLYGEELHMAEQAAQLCVDIVSVPDLRVVHMAHTVTHRSNRQVRARRKAESIRFIRETYYRTDTTPQRL